jgi:prepilin peptidase CpaA
MFEFLVLSIFPGAMIYAAISDMITMTISNWISIVLVAGFAALALWAGMPMGEIGTHIAVGLVALIVSFTCFALGWIGGGDAKFFAATALWFGWPAIIPYLFYASVFGGILTVILLSLNRLPLPAGLGRHEWVARLHKLEKGVPYGLALAAGGLVAYPKSVWMAGAF